jgi:hypothetical protein
LQALALARFSHAAVLVVASRSLRLVLKLPHRLALTRERRTPTTTISRHKAQEEDGGLTNKEE